MKNKIKLFNLFHSDDDTLTSLCWMLLLPIFLEAVTLYGALFAIITAVIITALCIGISAVTDKLISATVKLPMITILCGAVAILMSVVAEKLIENSYMICFSAVLYSLCYFFKYENIPGTFSQKIKVTLKLFAISACAVLVVGFLREILSSGRIFAGFNFDGLPLFNHKFESYINTASFIFLFAACVLAIFNKFHKNTACHTVSFKTTGIVKLSSTVMVIAVIFSSAVFFIGTVWSNNYILSKLACLLLYILSVALMIALGLISYQKYYGIVPLLVLTVSTYMRNASDITGFIKNTISLLLAIIFISVFCEYYKTEANKNNEYIDENDMPFYLSAIAVVLLIVTVIVH